jgi:outer membrane protein assembly factor BamD (BamD/ComL family)
VKFLRSAASHNRAGSYRKAVRYMIAASHRKSGSHHTRQVTVMIAGSYHKAPSYKKAGRKNIESH